MAHTVPVTTERTSQTSRYDHLVGATTAAGVLGVSRTTLHRLVDESKLFPVVRLGNALGFELADVERVRAERAAGKL